MAFPKDSAFPSRLVVVSGLLAGALALSVAAQRSQAGDWPQWQGPDRTGVSQEKGLLKSWPAAGPRLVWEAKGMGEGHCTPSIAGGRVYGMGLIGQDEVVWALDASNGKHLWQTPIAPKLPHIGGEQGGYGPRSSPTVMGNRMYVEGVEGDVACLDTNGRIVWRKSLVRDFGGQVPTWGYSESPLVDGDKVIVAPGGHAATIVALRASTGDAIWKAEVPQGDGAHYASAVVANIGGVRQYVTMLAGGVVSVAAADGKFLWRYDHPANHTANCTTPLVRGNLVFCASGYNNGGGLAQVDSSPSGFTVHELWFSPHMQDHHGGVVFVNDYLYGFDGSNLTCLDYKTGDVKWFNRSVGKGSVSYADGMLYVRSESGPVALVEANPAGYVEKGRFNQPDRSRANSWPHPVVSNGKLYLLDQDNLLCYDVKGPGAP